jgi:hypothetical protein
MMRTFEPNDAYGFKVQYECDAIGRRQKLAYPDATFITDIGQLDHIYDGASSWNFDYDAAGRRDKLTFPNNY